VALESPAIFPAQLCFPLRRQQAGIVASLLLLEAKSGVANGRPIKASIMSAGNFLIARSNTNCRNVASFDSDIRRFCAIDKT